MVVEHLCGRDVRDQRVLEAMARVPRHRFVGDELASCAYDDNPLSIGYGQTISQPYMVAKMTELARIREGSRTLEIGSGSGYQTAVLLELGAIVFGIEIAQPLARIASDRLKLLGYHGYQIVCRDGYMGWPEEAPFDAIIMGASPERVPPPLLDQLTLGGRLVAPVGPIENQRLYVLTREGKGIRREAFFPVRFVPMTGRSQSETCREEKS